MRAFALVACLLLVGCGIFPKKPLPISPALTVTHSAPTAHDPFTFQATYNEPNDTSKSVPGASVVVVDPPGLKSFVVTEMDLSSETTSPADQDIHKAYTVVVRNQTPQEIAAMTFRLTAYDTRNRRVVYHSPLIRFHRFRNSYFSSTGSLLPFDSAVVTGLRFDYPNVLWTSDIMDRVAIESVEVYRGLQDYHQPSHLYSFLRSAKPADALALFKAQPDLIDVKNDRGATALLMALVGSDSETIKYLVSRGASLKTKTFDDATAMDYAAMNWAHPDVWKYLLSQGVSVNARDSFGQTPLFYAVLAGSPDCVKWLTKNGADPNALDHTGHQAAFDVFYTARPDMLATLAASGCNPLFHDQYGQGWMHYAARFGRLEDDVFKLGVPVDNSVGPDNYTPLMTAAGLGYSQGEIWLLQHGADPFKKNANGDDCFDLSKLSNTLKSDEFFRWYVKTYGKKKFVDKLSN